MIIAQSHFSQLIPEIGAIPFEAEFEVIGRPGMFEFQFPRMGQYPSKCGTDGYGIIALCKFQSPRLGQSQAKLGEGKGYRD